MKSEIKVLKAFHGDCLLIKTFDSTGKEFLILIDGGPAETFDTVLANELKDVKKIDLLVLTHIDSDHIAGIIEFLTSILFQQVEIVKYWVNCKNLIEFASGELISYKQGFDLEKALIRLGEPPEKWKDEIVKGAKWELAPGISSTIISPTKDILDHLNENWPKLSQELIDKLKDVKISSPSKFQDINRSLKELSQIDFKHPKSLKSDVFNGASIAFILELLDCKILLLGDSRPEVLVESLKEMKYSTSNKLNVDFVKISHHGSKNNTSNELLDMIDCNNYIISTNGGNGNHMHPNREVFARLIYHPERNLSVNRIVYLNYPMSDIELQGGKFVTEKDFEEGNWQIIDDVTTLPQ